MKRFCIINVMGLRDATLCDDVPLDVEVLAGNYGPSPFYSDRDQAEKELFKLSEQYGPVFQIFESTEKAVIKQATVNGKSRKVLCIETIE